MSEKTKITAYGIDKNLWNMLLNYREVIETLLEERKWIPVSERLPEDCVRVLTHITNSQINTIVRGFYIHRLQEWRSDEVDETHKNFLLNVTHWMPLPELPEVKDE